jgi:hypothetical protein
MRGEEVTFHELVARMRSLKVNCVQGEIVDPTGICDIQCCKCLCSFSKVYDTNSSFMKTGTAF